MSNITSRIEYDRDLPIFVSNGVNIKGGNSALVTLDFYLDMPPMFNYADTVELNTGKIIETSKPQNENLRKIMVRIQLTKETLKPLIQSLQITLDLLEKGDTPQ